MSLVPTMSQQQPSENLPPPPRGLKYVSRRGRNSEEKIEVTFMESLQRVVGEKANEFIGDCSNWVEEFCPLNNRTWAKMDPEAHKTLYAKILGKYDLPEMVDGEPVIKVLSLQCSSLYRYWRYRLKEEHFKDKTLAQTIASKPPTIDEGEWEWLVFEYWNSDKQKKITEVNRNNKLKQTEIPANSSKSTARIFHDMINEPPNPPTQDLD